MEKKFKDLLIEHLEEENTQKDHLIDKINQLVHNYNKLVDYTKYNEEYIEAILFMNKFDFSMIMNDSLANKAKYTEYATLDYKQVKKPELFTLEKFNNNKLSSIDTSGNIRWLNTECQTLYHSTNVDTDTIKEYISEALKENKKEDKKPIEETPEEKYRKSVEYVKYWFNEMPKEIVYNVYKFLKDVLKEDEEFRKYQCIKDERND